MSNKSDSNQVARRDKLDSVTTKNAEAEANVQYESAVKPLLWLVIPFVLVLIYGYLS